MRSLVFRSTITALFIFISTSYLAGQSNQKVSDQDYYEFINSIAPDSVTQFNLASKPDFRHILEDTLLVFRDTAFFTPADVQFMRQQLGKGKHFKWKSNLITGAHIISSKKIRNYYKDGIGEGWKKFNTKYKGGFSRFSIPLFSLDRKTCIIYQSQHCGALCGGGHISLYKQVDDKWIFIKAIGAIWIS